MVGESRMTLSPLQHEVARFAAAGFAYVSICVASQGVQLHVLHVHGGMRFAPTLLGSLTVSIASMTAVAVGNAAAGTAHHQLSLPSPTAAVLGLTLFTALGGRCWRLSPSSLVDLGAHARTHLGSLPATLAYAGRAERKTIQALGRRYGCHSCGVRPWPWQTLGRGPGSLAFNADHQPPLATVKIANAALWRRMLKHPMSQRFYPQCVPCSGKQASLLSERAALAKSLGSARLAREAQTNAAPAVFHWQPQPHHAVGALLAAVQASAPKTWRRADEAAADGVKWLRQQKENAYRGLAKYDES